MDDINRESPATGADDIETAIARHAEAVRTRFGRSLLAAMAFVAALGALFFASPLLGDLRPWTLTPGELGGLVGVLTSPLLHGSAGHWLANGVALLILGPLAATVFPRATWRALPVIWLGSGLIAWALGEPGSHHLGASGLTHGLMFLVFALGVLRRDRAAIAAALIAFFFYGGMLLTVLPREAGVSWESHLGGAVAGLVAAVLWRRLDPPPPRRPWSWEEEAGIRSEAALEAEAEFEPPRPEAVPVLWQRAETPSGGVVLPFPSRPAPRDDRPAD
ncbi:rhomboid family intramembrane serine protease [Arenimonas composti]|uniref:Peptidase S54 rhomboid domain-containing protein n=1 Tax=Arenimonas composti TR7-09 = DSM 18010 TaxID=1121013 RepID=A0A091BDE1_9GAMM|nr:rhomboid family intramembrane serine protease [Arenimonas composti]KFN50703.1 hypothetical protein P873_05950 [Arenimonas composti TR7-09 = DSM 18010]